MHLRELSKGHGLDLAVDVDAVEQRTGDFAEVALDLSGGADAVVGGVAVVAAGAGVARGNEHERGGELYAVLGPRDADFAVFERLAHHFEGLAIELGEFVEERYLSSVTF